MGFHAVVLVKKRAVWAGYISQFVHHFGIDPPRNKTVLVSVDVCDEFFLCGKRTDDARGALEAAILEV